MTTARRIAFGPAVGTSLAEGGDREWLVADDCGGYAMGTCAACAVGLGLVSETADGDPPHAATGCPFQTQACER